MIWLTLACTGDPDTGTDDTVDTAEHDTAAAPTMLISGYNSDAVHHIDPAAGSLLSVIEGIAGAQSVRPMDDGLVAVAEKDGTLMRLSGDPLAASEIVTGLSNPTAAIAVDEALLVAEFSADRILRLDADTGEVLSVVAEELPGPDAGMLLEDGLLWVPCFSGNRIVALQPDSGEVVHTWEGIRRPRSLWWDDAGQLWATAWGDDAVVRFSAEGVPTVIAEVEKPSGLLADPDGVSLWVISDQDALLTRIDRTTGEVLSTLDAAALGVDGATFLAWHP